MDGTLGSQTAWMLDGSGVQITSGEELAEIVRRGAEAGFPVGVHAIGDRANREALDAFEQTRDVWEPRGLRQRIEHCQLLSPEDLPRFAELGITVLGAVLARSLGPRPGRPVLGGQDRRRIRVPLAARFGRGRRERERRADRGARPARRACAPACAARSTSAPPWHPEQALTVEQAFHATCVAPAWLARDERKRGTLAPGPRGRPRRPRPRPLGDLDAQVVATMVARPLGAQPAALGLSRGCAHRLTTPADTRPLAAGGGCFERLVTARRGSSPHGGTKPMKHRLLTPSRSPRSRAPSLRRRLSAEARAGSTSSAATSRPRARPRSR